METAHIMGIIAGILFIDLEKFYDSVDLVLLIKACNGLEYPRIPLLFVQAFLGPRTLRADGHQSEQIPVANGLVAGSSQVNHWARALLHRACMTTTTDVPRLFCRSSWMISRCTRMERPGRVQIRPTSRGAVPFSWQAQSRSVSFKMWIRGHHTLHCPLCVLRLAGSRFWYFLNPTCKRFGCCEEKNKTCICKSKTHSKVSPRNTRMPVASCSKEELYFRAHMVTRFYAFRPLPRSVCGLRQHGHLGDTVLECVPPLCLPSQKTVRASRLHAEVITE